MGVKRYSVWDDEMFEEKHALNSTNGMVHLVVKHEDYAALEQQLAAVVAENAGLKAGALQEIEVINRGGQAYCVKDGMSVNPIYARGWNDYRARSLSLETPATDAYLAEVRAQARNEGVNFAASRLAAAFNHGFVDKPLVEVYDVVRMILTAKEDLANDPAADGLSGEYAEKSLVEFAAQLRQGAAL